MKYFSNLLAGYLQNCLGYSVVREFEFDSRQRADIIFFRRDKVQLIELKKLKSDDPNGELVTEAAFGQLIRYAAQNTKIELAGSMIVLITDHPIPTENRLTRTYKSLFGVDVAIYSEEEHEQLIKTKGFRRYRHDIPFERELRKYNGERKIFT